MGLLYELRLVPIEGNRISGIIPAGRPWDYYVMLRMLRKNGEADRRRQMDIDIAEIRVLAREVRVRWRAKFGQGYLGSTAFPREPGRRAEKREVLESVAGHLRTVTRSPIEERAAAELLERLRRLLTVQEVMTK